MVNPLVSIFVVTYNAEEFIIDTLESIKNQDYSPIELIVSDDGSEDQTIPLVGKWLEINKTRFVNTNVITVANNTGVSANYNRALSACNGEWIKNVDGDDILLPDCISENLTYVKSHPDVDFVFSKINLYKKEKGWIEIEYDNTRLQKFCSLNQEEQLMSLSQYNYLPSQTFFARGEVLKKFPYNEHYMGIEDYPKWFELSKRGYRFYYIDKVTSLYRICQSTTKSSTRFFSPFYMNSLITFFWNELAPFLKEKGLDDAYNKYRRSFLLYELADGFLGNKKTSLHKVVYRFFNKCVNRIKCFN